jgi:hypothetical protein
MRPAALLIGLLSVPATAQTTLLGSVGVGGAPADGRSSNVRGTPELRWIVWHSDATNLVPGDQNGFRDVFWRDTWSGAQELASLSSSGQQGNADSQWPTVSADARFVAFQSYATNLVPNDGNAAADVFVRDRVAGTTICASLAPNGCRERGQPLPDDLARRQQDRLREHRDGPRARGRQRSEGHLRLRARDGRGALPQPGPRRRAGRRLLGRADLLAPTTCTSCSRARHRTSSRTTPTASRTSSSATVASGAITRASEDANGIGGDGPGFDAYLSLRRPLGELPQPRDEPRSGRHQRRDGHLVKDLLTGAMERASLTSYGGQVRWDC